MIFIIKHIAIEGPGTLGQFLSQREEELEIVELWKGNSLPPNIQKVKAIVSLGGPMNVYEEEKYPFLREEDKFLKEALAQEKPILGICLGAQLLAKACGAKVEKAAQKEIGWFKVNLTKEGKEDPIFRKVNSPLEVFQWHGDTFQLPPGGVLLAESSSCQNQAFRVGKRAYGFQFHIEITEEMIKTWLKEYSQELNSEGLNSYHQPLKPEKVLSYFRSQKSQFTHQANQIYSNLWNNITNNC